MDRSVAIQKLHRILARIDAGGLPIPVKAVWVYGSFARGALTVGDVDLYIVVGDYKTLRPDLASWRCPLRIKLTEELRRRGERVQVLFGREVDRAYFFAGLTDAYPTILWAENFRDWRVLLDRIKPNPAAGRLDRPGSLFMEHPGWDRPRNELEEVDRALNTGRLKLSRIPMDDLVRQLRRADVDAAQRLLRDSRLGSANTIPVQAALGWLRTLGATPSRTVWHTPWQAHSRDGRNSLYVGRPPISWANRLLEDGGRDRFCGLPYYRKTRQNFAWVFERGAYADGTGGFPAGGTDHPCHRSRL